MLMKTLHALMGLLPAVMIHLSPSSFGAGATEAQSHVANYRRAGKALIAMALTKRISTTEATPQVEVLIKEAIWLAESYSKAHPSGAKLLKMVTDSIPEMKKLTFEELERQWHDLHYFDGKKSEIGLDLSVEDNEHFTDPIHVLVHPLLVLKAVESYTKSEKAELLTQIKEEMEEGIEQAEKAAAALGGK